VKTERDLVAALVRHEAWRTRLRAVGAMGRAAAAVPPDMADPELSLRREQAFGGGVAFDTTVVGIGTAFPLRDRRGPARRAGVRHTEALHAAAEADLRDGVCRLRERLLGAQRSRGTIERLAAHRSRLDAVAADLDALIAGGERAPFERDRLRLLARALDRRREGERAVLAAHMGAAAALSGVAVDEPVDVDVPPLPGADAAERSALERHPRLRALRAAVAAAKANQGVADALDAAELGVWAGARLDRAPGTEAGGGYEAAVTLSLPVLDRHARDRAVAEARHIAAEAEVKDAERRLRSAVAEVVAEAAALEGRLRAGVLDTDGVRSQAHTRFRSGVGSFTDLVDTLGTVEDEVHALHAMQYDAKRLRLRLACRLRGAPEPEVDALIDGATR